MRSSRFGRSVSKGVEECQKQAVVSISFEDLQEMQNHMRETIDQGLQQLQAKQGKGGLPAAPSSAQAPPVPAQYASIAPPSDPSAAAEIQQQAQQADQAEKEVTAKPRSRTLSINEPLSGHLCKRSNRRITFTR